MDTLAKKILIGLALLLLATLAINVFFFQELNRFFNIIIFLIYVAIGAVGQWQLIVIKKRDVNGNDPKFVLKIVVASVIIWFFVWFFSAQYLYK